jgi:aldose 1-epimerase
MVNAYHKSSGMNFGALMLSQGLFMIRNPAFVAAFFAAMIITACFTAKGAGPAKLQVAGFGKSKEGHAVYRYILSNRKGLEAVVISYGAALVSLRAADRSGRIADIVLGYDDVNRYEQDKSYFGTTIGRYGNRIAGGQFTLDGIGFHLPKNDGPNSLDGGIQGFNQRVWMGVHRSNEDAQVLELSYGSQDGEEGNPGTLEVKVTYPLPAETNELRIDYYATTGKDTVLYLTNHGYFHLSCAASQGILGHQLLLHALEFTSVDSTLIPTGELRAARDTPFDFSKPAAIGARISQDDEQLKFGKGYDHNWALARTEKAGLQAAAEVFEATSGRVLEVLTTEAGIQFCSRNFLDGTARGKSAQASGHRTGFCMETQHFPDSPNHRNSPSAELRSGQTYRSTTVFRLKIRK